MAALPDELWLTVLEAGVNSSVLTHQDLCALGSVSRRMLRLSEHELLWGILFQATPGFSRRERESASWKEIFKRRYEEDRAARAARHQRQVMREQSKLFVLRCHVKAMTEAKWRELEKLKQLFQQVKLLETSRSAHAAVQVWQPSAVRTAHQLLVEQSPIHPEMHLQSLKQDISLCRLELSKLDRRLQEQEKRVRCSEREVDHLMRDPLGPAVHSQTQTGQSSSHKGKGRERKPDVESVVCKRKRSWKEVEG